MIDVGSMAALAGSFKTIGDIAKAMIDLRDEQTFRGKAIDLQREVMTAQSMALAAFADQAAMVKRIGELEEQTA